MWLKYYTTCIECIEFVQKVELPLTWAIIMSISCEVLLIKVILLEKALKIITLHVYGHPITNYMK